MNIQQQDGLVSTINLTPFTDSDADHRLRDRLFEMAAKASSCPPKCRLDTFDESIVVFDSCYQALSFLTSVFRCAVDLQKNELVDFTLRSSLCFGNYFIHQDQIYGDAVNLATKLTLTSRENEMLLCGLDSEVIESFLDKHSDLSCFLRSEDDSCMSIAISDRDSTFAKYSNMSLQVDFNNQSCRFNSARCQKIEIGRSEMSGIRIDSDQISRHHATIKLHYDEIYFEDHSSNGTYIYFNDREVFLTNESMKIGSSGLINCGLSRESKGSEKTSISYQMIEKTLTAA